MNRKEIEDRVYNYPTKYPQGFIKEEMEELIKEYPNLNKEKFDNALMGNTCMMIDKNIIIYHCDVYKALKCGIENRDLTLNEWD